LFALWEACPGEKHKIIRGRKPKALARENTLKPSPAREEKIYSLRRNKQQEPAHQRRIKLEISFSKFIGPQELGGDNSFLSDLREGGKQAGRLSGRVERYLGGGINESRRAL